MQATQNTLQEAKDTAQDSVPARARAAAENGLARAADLAARAGQSARNLIEEGQAAAAERVDATSRWVGDATRRRPLRTLGIVAAMGILVGLLIGRR